MTLEAAMVRAGAFGEELKAGTMKKDLWMQASVALVAAVAAALTAAAPGYAADEDAPVACADARP